MKTNCKDCRHFFEEAFLESGERIGRCRGFKERIPQDIFECYKEHNLPLRGDNGYRFTPKESVMTFRQTLLEAAGRDESAYSL